MTSTDSEASGRSAVDVCPDCGRTTTADAGEIRGWERCIRTGTHSCEIVAAAYQRGRRDGIDEGVALVKSYIDMWPTDVDAAAEKAKGQR